jgi:methionyl-tRNA formyltransferase
MMKKVLLLCTSDILGIPAILKLKQQGMLAALAIPDKIAGQFLPILRDAGIETADVKILSRKKLETELNELIGIYQPDALFTVTFPWMIPNSILNTLSGRCINFHFGLLPKYKGAEPIFWQMKNGDAMGGISIHQMTDQLDNGPMLYVEELPIYPGETYGMYAQRLGVQATEAVVKVLAELNTKQPEQVQEASTDMRFFNAPTLTDLTINWQQQTATEIEQLVNASNPRYGGALTTIRNGRIYLFEVAPADINNPNDEQFPPGTIVHADLLYGLIVACINKQFIKINVVCLQQGYFSGSKLFSLGFRAGEVFA